MEKSLKPDPKYYTKCTWVTLTATAAAVLLMAAVHLIINLAEGNPAAPAILWPVVLGLLALVWIVVYPLVRLWVKNLEYVIYDDRITIHKGFLTKRKQNIPLRAITDFVLDRTIYDRVLGIGSIKIQTAGQSQSSTGYEGVLAGLADYDPLHEELRGMIRNLHPRAESLAVRESEEETSEPVLLRILEEIKSIRESIERK